MGVGEQCTELREDHGGRAPDAGAVHFEVRHVHNTVRWDHSHAFFPGHGIRLQQARHRQLDQTFDFVGRDRERRSCRGHAEDRLQQVATDDHWNRRETAEDLDVGGNNPDLLIRFAQRRMLYLLPWMIETSTGQRHLPGVMTQARAAHGERHVPDIIVRIDQQECCRGAKARLQRRIGAHQRPGRHAQLRLETRQGSRQSMTQGVGQ